MLFFLLISDMPLRSRTGMVVLHGHAHNVCTHKALLCGLFVTCHHMSSKTQTVRLISSRRRSRNLKQKRNTIIFLV